MNTTFAPRLMPAQNPTDPDPITGTHGEGVKAMSLFESRKGGGKRAWDELSEIDRAVLLEAVRQRRKHEQEKARIHNEIYRLRSNR